MAWPLAATEIPWASESVVASDATAARAVETADVDGDGDLDLLSASFNDDTIAWYENDGAENFTKRTVTVSADGARSVASGDLDGDGDLDLVSASQNDDKIAWYENTGGSPLSFTPRVITQDPDGPFIGSNGFADSATSVAVADIDRDGHLDIVFSAAGTSLVAWFQNDGTPADDANSADDWNAVAISLTFTGATSVVPADVDGDGWLDVVSASFTGDTIQWFENDGTPATLGWVVRTVNSASSMPDGPRSVQAADMDGDGDLDILSASANDDTVRIYESSGASPPAFTTHELPADDDQAWSVRAADLDRDGDLDILAASFGDDTVRWYENTGFPAFTERPISTGVTDATGAVAADVDGDGDLDVATSSQGDDTIAWFENLTIHRSALFPSEAVITSTAFAARSAIVSDVNGDGALDVLAASRLDEMDDDEVLFWHENDTGDASSWPRRSISGAEEVRSLFAADIDGDGDQDLVTASTPLSGPGIAWWENRVDQSLSWVRHDVSTSDQAGGYSAVAADMDGDGDTDILAATINASDDAYLSLYLNSGDGSTWGRQALSSTETYQSVAAADIDGDGDLDAVAAAANADTVEWLENGTGWTARAITSLADDVRSVAVADLDGDGDLDVVSASWRDDTVAWYRNLGGSPPAFSTLILTEDPDEPFSGLEGEADGASSVFAADLDGDGDPDVVSVSTRDDKLAWYENTNGAGTFGAQQVISTARDYAASGDRKALVADIDGDGDGDLLSAAWGDGTISWRENLGGQFALRTTDRAQSPMLGGQVEEVFAIEVAHRGRAGDTDLELATLELLFEASPEVLLEFEQAQALLQEIRVYLDDGSGAFEAAIDTPVVTISPVTVIGGVQTVPLGDGDANAQVAYAAPRTYFVVLQIQPDAASQSPASFLVTHRTESTSSAEDRVHDLPLVLEYAMDLGTGRIDTFLQSGTRCWAPFDLNLPGGVLNATLICEAGQDLRAGGGSSFTVGSGGDLTLRAGRGIELGDGFNVFGTLAAEIDP